MRQHLFLLLIFCSCLSIAQINSDVSLRAKRGELSFEECMKFRLENRLDEAIPSLLQLKGQYEKNTQFDELLYYGVVISLHYHYIGIGDFASSQKLLSEAMSVYNQRSSNSNTEHIRILWCCMGQLEVMLKNFAQALSYLHQAQIMFEAVNDFGESYLVMLMNMGISYMGNGDFLSAKIYMDEARDIFENLHGSIFQISNEEHFVFLSNYGLLYHQIGYDDVAEMCFKHVINNCKKTDLSYDAYTLACNNLAAIFIKQGRYDESESMLSNLTSINPENSYIFIQNLALCYYFQDKEPSSLQSIKKYNMFSKDNALNVFTQFPDTERDKYWEQISQESLMMNNLLGYHFKTPEFQSIAYNNTLFYRNLSIKAQKIVDNYIKNDSSAYLAKLSNEYKTIKMKLCYKSTNPIERRELFNQLIIIEREILSSISNLKEQLLKVGDYSENVKSALNDDEVAIEYTYIPIMSKYDDLTGYYGVFIIKKGWDAPKMIILDKVDDIEDIIYDNEPDELFLNQLYGKEKMKTLYKMLWSKLESYLYNIRTVYYSPTGFLSHLNYEQLQDSIGQKLGNRYNLIRVSSTSNIANYKQNKQKYYSATLFGNIPYDESVVDMAIESSNYSTFSGEEIGGSLSLRSVDDRGRWGVLPFTKQEIDSIDVMFTNNGIATKLYEGAKGNEESFKALSGNSPDIIHLATHGFVIDTQKKAEGNKFVEGTFAISPREGYLTWTGLMLAGANNAWTGNFNLENVEDGILTADEISRLDLSNTKLVVLSACETARGKIDPVEGVLGLQRAFKKAGAQTIVMSLWKVPDESTSILMTEFYRNLMNGVEIHQALKNAENRVKELYPDPYYWAGFIILD